MNTLKPVKIYLLCAPTLPCSSTTIIYTALLSTVHLALFLLAPMLENNDTGSHQQHLASARPMEDAHLMSEEWLSNGKWWYLLSQAAKASPNGNDALIEGDNATDVNTESTGAQSWIHNTCRAVDAPTTITVDAELEMGSCYLAHAKPSSGGLSQTELSIFIPLFIPLL